MLHLNMFRGENVEDAFLETARKIYQNIQDGRSVLLHWPINQNIN